MSKVKKRMEAYERWVNQQSDHPDLYVSWRAAMKKILRVCHRCPIEDVIDFILIELEGEE
ncbi:hypothetical protein KA005_69675 [bacterium]|nr:hypothetical protein [bacterium]